MGIAAFASLASVGLQAAGAVSAGGAQAAGAAHQAQNSLWASQAATVNANETDAWYRDNLRKTLSNIDAMRASAGANPDSPTTQAIADENRRVSDDQRVAKVVGIRAQANQDMADSEYYQHAAKTYMNMGLLTAGMDVMGGLAKGAF